MGLIIIVIALIGLMYFAYRGYSIILIAPIFAVIAAIGSGYAVMPIYSELYMTKAAEYIKNYYPIFLWGAVFAKIMEVGGLAASVASKIVETLGKDRAILAVLLGCGALSYGGLSVFVVAFVMYPFAAILFRKAQIPKRLLPATLWMGILTYAMIAIPGTPQIQNIIPTAFFGTTTWAGIHTGLLAAILYFAIAWLWITYRYKKLASAGEGYGSYTLNEPEDIRHDDLPRWYLAVLPLILVVIINLLISNPFSWQWAYYWNSQSLAPFSALNLPLLAPSVNRVQAIWSINVALIVSSIVAAYIGRKRLKTKGGLIFSVNDGAIASASAVLNVASGYAFGSVVALLPGFQAAKDALLHINSSGSPLLSAIITTNIMTAITGSASGGLTIALGMLGDEWLTWAHSIQMSPEILHRIICIASEGLDTMPHAGALVTLIAVCGLTHKDSYYDVFVLTLLKTTIAFIVWGFYNLTGLN
ncbi:GntP family permease [Pectinatus haikarae]|uniref:H+/gluconate symporter-like permease n=1 Tax=Pectinatus haikarae TaxID=349096 RepID=A0ABT9Y934_9FIRM|nr:GntP family permease [Pectinatus haikarae]MDQ0204148.1 H+/gluconate symporter-like permease [Pectinatus haikarae]